MAGMRTATWSLILVLGVSCCGPSSGRSEEEDFLLLPSVMQREQITKYPPKAQVDLYLRAMRESHPPDYGLVTPVAAEAEVVLPYVAAKLEGAEDELDQFRLIVLVTAMQRQGFYPVRGDSAVLSLVKRVVRAMDEPSLKAEAKAMLAYLERDEQPS